MKYINQKTIELNRPGNRLERATEKFLSLLPQRLAWKLVPMVIAVFGLPNCAPKFPSEGNAQGIIAYGLLNQCHSLKVTGTSILASGNNTASKFNYNLQSDNPLCDQLNELSNPRATITLNGNAVTGNVIAAGTGVFRVEADNNGYFSYGQPNLNYSLDIVTDSTGRLTDSGSMNMLYSTPVLISVTPIAGSSNLDPNTLLVRYHYQLPGMADANTLASGGYTLTQNLLNAQNVANIFYEAAAQNGSIQPNYFDVVQPNITGTNLFRVPHNTAFSANIQISHTGVQGNFVGNTNGTTTATDSRPTVALNSINPGNGSSTASIPYYDLILLTSPATTGLAGNFNVTVTHQITSSGTCTITTYNYSYPGAQVTVTDLGSGFYRVRYTPSNGAGGSGGFFCTTTNNQITFTFNDGPSASVSVAPNVIGPYTFSSP